MTFLEEKIAKKAEIERKAYQCPSNCIWCKRTYYDGQPVRHGNGWVILNPDGVVRVEEC